ncbi:hypothetical protein NUU61_003143 [Penicillium alfredii]|uniref:Gag1-like clamp domain-containing protein n=1 Tax=Penicillium alfredii TaxID=1506179 RepID=A0A9W9KH77_9EURO|nr:uncharacterized protein NUU61_003143 [Penicillium alfredii]KAJ5105796.1 hypothetical protein NUU61_003143 [Penicillium alfredii]
MSAETRDTAIREAKIFVREVTRNDWEFNPADPDSSHPAPASSTSYESSTLSHGREVSEWRVREFDSSGSELEPQSSDHELDMESPSALRAAGDPGIERRRKRRRQMEEEMSWNEGLRMWMARRDVWAGARTRRQLRATEDRRKRAGGGQPHKSNQADGVNGVSSSDNTGAGTASPSSDQKDHVEGHDAPAQTAQTDSAPAADREKNEELQRQPAQDQEEEQSTAPDEETKRKESTETSITEPDAQASSTDPTQLTKFPTINDEDEDEDEIEEEELDEPLLPVAPSFISPTNPIRSTINPSIYPSIYTKVVVQGMTPTIPVNLADLTKSMVQGWKTDGQWPPKPAVSSIVLADDATVPKKDADRTPSQSRRKNSITNAVRKVFHFGSHPFHRRGSNSNDAGAGNGTGPVV